MKWMKGMIMAVALWIVASGVRAQSIDAMAEQITALKGFIVTAQQGYQLAEDGLHTIRDIKNGEFKLHSLFFGSLSSVNPAVRDMPQVAEIIALQAGIVKQFSNALAGYKQTGLFSAGEMGYMEGVYEKLIGLGSEYIDALQDLLADGSLEMTDGERIRRIGEIDKEIEDEYGFVQAFTQEASLLLAQRQEEAAGVGVLQLGMLK
jgi:hypothetical protein